MIFEQTKNNFRVQVDTVYNVPIFHKTNFQKSISNLLHSCRTTIKKQKPPRKVQLMKIQTSKERTPSKVTMVYRLLPNKVIQLTRIFPLRLGGVARGRRHRYSLLSTMAFIRKELQSMKTQRIMKSILQSWGPNTHLYLKT